MHTKYTRSFIQSQGNSKFRFGASEWSPRKLYFKHIAWTFDKMLVEHCLKGFYFGWIMLWLAVRKTAILVEFIVIRSYSQWAYNCMCVVHTWNRCKPIQYAYKIKPQQTLSEWISFELWLFPLILIHSWWRLLLLVVDFYSFSFTLPQDNNVLVSILSQYKSIVCAMEYPPFPWMRWDEHVACAVVPLLFHTIFIRSFHSELACLFSHLKFGTQQTDTSKTSEHSQWLPAFSIVLLASQSSAK